MNDKTYATCELCEQEMKPGTPCTYTHFKLKNGTIIEKIMTDEPVCPDCNAPMGSPHHPGCDNERCPVCGGQAIGCPCLDGVHDLKKVPRT